MKDRIYYLLDVYTAGQATDAEISELFEAVRDADEQDGFKDYMLELWEQHQHSEDFSYVNWPEMYSAIMQNGKNQFQTKDRADGAFGKIRLLFSTRAAAACIVIIILSAITYLLNKHSSAPALVDRHPLKTDIGPPVANKAVLTLADGSKIQLDSTVNGTVAVQGNIQVVKQSSGQISYAGNADGRVSYNTLSVPKGSKPMSVILADGSQVWINVGSTLTFPTAFVGHERMVQMTGEAYFEIRHNAKMPFVVTANEVNVRDLGTHFNVNSYADEGATKVTLLEGSVKVSKGSLQSRVISPGQQARIGTDLTVLNNVEIDEVMAWKEGKFRFGEHVNIENIMTQIGRWYNVRIIYKGTVKQHFWGSVSRDVSLSQLLKVLETAGGVKFQTEGDTVTVMPAGP
jgi:transmembrane sensor